jgi:hypothetical protein
MVLYGEGCFLFFDDSPLRPFSSPSFIFKKIIIKRKEFILIKKNENKNKIFMKIKIKSFTSVFFSFVHFQKNNNKKEKNSY